MTPLARHALDGHGSFTWIARPEEWMRRASTALVVGVGTLLVDPLEADGLDDALAPLPPVAGVVTLLDRHGRDAAAIAARLGVPRLAPDPLPEAGGARLRLPDVAAIPIPAFPRWREAALWLPDRRLLVVADALGTAPYYRHRDDRLAVHPLLRLRPPRDALGGLGPSAIACGHGEPVLDDAAVALATALATARGRLPGAWRRALRAAR